MIYISPEPPIGCFIQYFNHLSLELRASVGHLAHSQVVNASVSSTACQEMVHLFLPPYRIMSISTTRVSVFDLLGYLLSTSSFRQRGFRDAAMKLIHVSLLSHGIGIGERWDRASTLWECKWHALATTQCIGVRCRDYENSAD